MVRSTKKILFVSHQAELSGAPVILLESIKQFGNQSSIQFSILIIEDGILVEQFKKVGKTFVWKKNFQHKTFLIRFYLNTMQFFKRRLFLFQIRGSNLVYFSSIVSGVIHKTLLYLKCKYLYHVLELE